MKEMGYCLNCGRELGEGQVCGCDASADAWDGAQGGAAGFYASMKNRMGIGVPERNATDVYERGMNIVPECIGAVEGEIPVRQYDVAVLRNMLKFERAEGRMQVTNRRVVFRVAGRSIGGRTTLQHEFSVADIAGVEARRDYKFSIIYLIFAFIILNLASIIISCAAGIFSGQGSPLYDIRPASENMMTPPHILRVREAEREAMLERQEAEERLTLAVNAKNAAASREQQAINERIAAEKRDAANPNGYCRNDYWSGTVCDKAYYKNQATNARNNETAAIAAKASAETVERQASAQRDMFVEKEKTAIKKRVSAEKTWTVLMILFGLILGFGGLAVFFRVYKRFGLKLFALPFSSFGFLLCQAAHHSIIFLMLLMVSLIVTVVCVFIYCFRPNLVIGIKNRMGAVEPINIRAGRKIGFFEVIPTEETERAIREMGAIIGDIQKMGDDGVGKWATGEDKPSAPKATFVAAPPQPQHSALPSRPAWKFPTVSRKHILIAAAAVVVCVIGITTVSIVRANRHKSFFSSGMTCLAKENYAGAIEYFSKAIKSNSKEDANYYFQRGTAYSKKEDYAKAVMDYSEAIRLAPQNVSYYSDRADARLAVKDYSGAVTDFVEALRLDPSNASYYSGMAEAYLSMKDFRAAITGYSQAIRLAPNEAKYYNSRGNVNRMIENYDEAIADHAEAIRNNPGDARYHNNRGVAYLLKKDYDNAIANYTEAIQRAPNEAKYYNNRGSAYNYKKDFSNAATDFEEAIRLDPNNEEYRKNFENANKSLDKAKK
jgi:Flp pilus assembly protein TadD